MFNNLKDCKFENRHRILIISVMYVTYSRPYLCTSINILSKHHLLAIDMVWQALFNEYKGK